MKFFLLSVSLIFSLFHHAESGTSQCRLRVMEVRELTQQADLIARVRVKKVREIHDPLYGQFATLEVVEMIKGDPRLKEVTVWAKSKTYCATDSYERGQEFLVFLAHEQTLYRTLNYQYGQFLLNDATIKGWRTPGADLDALPDRVYDQVKAEIQGYIEASRQSENGNPPQPNNGQPVPKP